MVAARAWERRVTIKWERVPFCKMKNVLELEDGFHCTNMSTYCPRNGHLKIEKMVNVTLHILL